MRKILAGFMATAMVTSICATASMAAASIVSPSVTITPTALSVKPVATTNGVGGGNTITASTLEGKAVVSVSTTSFDIVLKNSASKEVGTINVPMKKDYKINYTPKLNAGATAIEFDAGEVVPVKDLLAAAAVGGKASVSVDGKVYSGTITANGTSVKVQFDGAAVIDIDERNCDFVLNYTQSATDFSAVKAEDNSSPVQTVTLGAGTDTVTAVTSTIVVDKGTAPETSDVTKTGKFFTDLAIKDVVLCDGNGNPLPMTDKEVGVDKALNDQGGVQSGNTLYFMIRDDVINTFADDSYWKLKISKGDNGKMIKAITDTTKLFSGGLYNANNGIKVSADNIDFAKRHRYIKVELNEIYTDDEYKITLDLRLSPTSKAESKYADQGVDGSEIKIKDFSFWMKNIVKTADNDWKVGIGGLMLNPISNDWNNVTYYDEDGDVAFMRFFGDSDVGKFYAKLSTKWAHEDYAAYFNDQDAFYFEFTGSPKLSSTSRADLQIYNPFVDEDGNETIDPTTATIYQVVDGDLIDVTESFTYGEGENGEDAFITRTRFLGQYIICEKPVEEAVGDADIDDLMPDDMETPDDVTPDAGNNGGKAPANTGRYL